MNIVVGPNRFQRLALPSDAFYLYDQKGVVLTNGGLELELSSLMFNGRSDFTLVLPKDPSLKVLIMAALALVKDYPTQYQMEQVDALMSLAKGWTEPKGDLLTLVQQVTDTPLLPVQVRIGMILVWVRWGCAEF